MLSKARPPEVRTASKAAPAAGRIWREALLQACLLGDPVPGERGWSPARASCGNQADQNSTSAGRRISLALSFTLATSFPAGPPDAWRASMSGTRIFYQIMDQETPSGREPKMRISMVRRPQPTANDAP